MVPFLVAILSFSCEDDDSDPLDDLVGFEFRLLDEAGKPSTTFQRGENFVLSFLIINRSDQRLTFFQRIDDMENFFRVFKTGVNADESSGEVIDMGRPWKTIFCEYVLGLGIPSGDTLKLEMPWMATSPWEEDPHFIAHFCLLEKTPPLGKGQYHTGFSSAFYFSQDGHQFNTKNQSFNINFEIL